jgi:membrane fusion protein, multidrug efflux system
MITGLSASTDSPRLSGAALLGARVSAPLTKRRGRDARAPKWGILAIATFVLAGCTKPAVPAGGSDPGAGLPTVPARVVTARIENVPAVTEVTGTVRPIQRATLAAKVMGTIDELPVSLGQRVRAGDLLVRISAGEISARVAQAQSQLNAARRDLERERGLLAKGASTADMVKGLEDRFAAAEAMVNEAEIMLGYVRIRAPFDGVIARKLVNAGDLAAPGVPLLDIEGSAGFEVEAALPDSLTATLGPGTPVNIEVPAAGIHISGTIAELSSAADAAARTVLAKITVPANPALRSGQFARVQLPGAPVAALLVPATAVGTVGQIERVFVADSANRAILRLVKTGAARGDRIEILAGLDDGERIVLAPPPALREGRLMEILP